MLNGAEGMGQLFNQVLGMGAAAIPMLRDMLQQPNGDPGSKSGRPAPAKVEVTRKSEDGSLRSRP